VEPGHPAVDADNNLRRIVSRRSTHNHKLATNKQPSTAN
jgi:hypothetical protein